MELQYVGEQGGEVDGLRGVSVAPLDVIDVPDDLGAKLVKQPDWQRPGQGPQPAEQTVDELFGAVGDDPDKARAALAAETAEGGKNRSTVVKRLTKIINAEEA